MSVEEQQEVPRELSGARLDEVLAALFPSRSKAAWQKQVRRGGVRLDGRRVLRSNLRVSSGARLRVELEGGAGAGRARDLTVLHEDEHLAVVDKPAGLLTHGNERQREETLADLAVRQLGRLPMLMGDHRPGIVHRLDRDTSGVMVLARTPEAMEGLREAFRSRRVHKEYLAIVHGAPEPSAFTVEEPLGPEAPGADRQCVRADGRPSRTRFEFVERLGELSVLRCLPETGRRHQIRAHLWHAGLPLLADPIYGLRKAPPLPGGATRPREHALHAARLTFEHPCAPAEIDVSAPLRPDLLQLLERLRGNDR